MKEKLKGLSEASLKNAVREACAQDWNKLQQDMKDYEHVFSAEFEEKMEKLVSMASEETANGDGTQQDDAQPIRLSGRKRKKHIWRYLLIAALLAGLGIGSILTNGSIIERVGNMFLHIYEHTVHWQGTENQNEEFVPYYPEYIPEGYQISLAEKSQDLFSLKIKYKNMYGEWITYKQLDQSWNIDISIENNDIERAKIYGTEAEIISDGDTVQLCLKKMDIYFT